MIEGLITGTLLGLAEQRQGKNDTTFVLAKVKVTPGEGESLIVNVIAFAAEACAALLALDEGDALALSGALTPKVWSDKQGNTRPALDMVASQVLTVYTWNANARPWVAMPRPQTPEAVRSNSVRPGVAGAGIH